MDQNEFRERLYAWAAEHPRPLPWKGESDPYRIWLSEVLLQQTRVEQGMPYYQRFVAAYPVVQHLAAAPESEVMKLWEGLGYYSRARNLHAAAKYVAHALDGVFPADFSGLMALPGVGAYTAAAIASFAYDQPHAVLDGNVYRVLARVFGYTEPVDRPEAKTWFAEKAQEMLDPQRPGAYNQAIMDFGATCCTPRRAACSTCPMAKGCFAFREGLAGALPRKSPKQPRRKRIFLYAVIRREDVLYVRERTEKDIWQNLWEFPMLEVDSVPAENSAIAGILLDHFFDKTVQQNVKIERVTGPLKQVLTHQEVRGFFAEMRQNDPFWQPNPDWNWRAEKQFALKKMYAKPRLVDRFLTENPLSLSLF